MFSPDDFLLTSAESRSRACVNSKSTWAFASTMPIEPVHSAASFFLSPCSITIAVAPLPPSLLATTNVSPHFSPHRHHGKSPIFTYKLYPNAGHSQNEDKNLSTRGWELRLEVKPLSIFSSYSAHPFFISSATIQQWQHQQQQKRWQPTWPTGCGGPIHVRQPSPFPCCCLPFSPFPTGSYPCHHVTSPSPHLPFPLPSPLYTYVVVVDLYMGQIYMTLAWIPYDIDLTPIRLPYDVD